MTKYRKEDFFFKHKSFSLTHRQQMMNDITFTDSHFEPEKRGYLMLQEFYSWLP